MISALSAVELFLHNTICLVKLLNVGSFFFFFLTFGFIFIFILLIYLWLCWVFVSV